MTIEESIAKLEAKGYKPKVIKVKFEPFVIEQDGEKYIVDSIFYDKRGKTIISTTPYDGRGL